MHPSWKEASDPSTSPERLEELSPHYGFFVAQNPSAPLPLLLRLAERYPELIERNPIWELLLLEDPNFLHKHQAPQLRFLQQKETPTKFLFAAQHHPSIEAKLLLAQNPKCPTEILSTLAIHQELHRNIAQNPNCPTQTLEQLASSNDEKVRAAVARNPLCSEKYLSLLSQDKSDKVRATAARHPRCPAQELSRLARDEIQVRVAVAARPDCPVEVMKMLASDQRGNVQSQIAQKRDCPPEILLLLAKNMFIADRIKRLLSEHPNCPTEVLAVLLRCNTHDIRLRARRHKNAPREIIALLQDLPNITREQYILLVNEHYLSNREASLHPLHDYALPIRFIPWHSRFNRGRPREETDQ